MQDRRDGERWERGSKGWREIGKDGGKGVGVKEDVRKREVE